MMKKTILFAIIISTSLIVNALQKCDPPKTQKISGIDTVHNVTLTNNYHWLEDKNDERVIEWTQKQHDYGVDFLSRTKSYILD